MTQFLYMYVCMYVCLYIYIYIYILVVIRACVCVYIYIYIYMYTYTYRYNPIPTWSEGGANGGAHGVGGAASRTSKGLPAGGRDTSLSLSIYIYIST